RQLRGFPLVLDLPADRSRPLEQTGRGGRWPVAFNSARTEALRSLSRREGISRFMLLTALAATLFHRLSGQDRLITGTLNANRGRPEVEPLLGFFITQLPLAIDLSGDPTFRELLARVRAMALGAFTHQHLPFGKLVEALQPERDASRPPVVQALIQLLDAQPGATAGLGSLEIEALDVFDGNARYDLMLGLFEHTDSMAGWLEYNADVFDPATMARMEELLGALLDAAIAEPGKRLSALPAFTAACRHQVLVEWNDTAFPGEPPGVIDLFAAQATLTPTATAWKGESEETSWSLTFAELDVRSNQLARHLRSLGIGTESLVGIYLERTAELPVAILGVLKSGAAYLPLDLSLPAERRDFMLADAGAAAILTQESLLSSLPDSGMPRLCLASLLSLPSLPSLFSPLPPESRAYVIYTSGSTGLPKGVEISHRALANFLRTMRGLFALGPGDTLPALTTIAFDIAVAEMFLPMLAGGTTSLLSAATARDGVLLGQALDALRPAPSVIQATPATWRMLLEAGWPGSPESLLVSTAEPLSRNLADHLLPLGRGLWNLYGPTETTVWSTAWRVAPEGPISIGRSLAETRLFLLDRSLAPVPLGAKGELCIGGLGVARGYLGRPELTAERFIPDAFSDSPGDRLYRTGDLVRLRPDGLVDSLGRADHQVKLRGFRIELGEIEAALRRHPAVSEAVVLLREDRPGDPRLAAYLGLVPEAEAPTPGQLRQELAERLPDYMVPSAFVVLPSLPLNANGKVDRKALAEIRAEGAAGGPRVRPRTPVEELLAALWSEVLEVEEVGAFDDFFDLGGHSLLATQLVMRMRDVFGVELPLRAIFQAPTLAAQAERVEQARGGKESRRAQNVCHVARAPRDRDLPLSFAQERLWFLDQLTPGSPVYNVPVAFALRGPLNLPALEHAFAQVVRRHEVLRTSFPSHGIQPVQEIAPPSGWTLPMEDPNDWHAAAAAEALRPFDLAAGPILRTRLLRLAPEEHVLLLTVHHIAADLWGVAVLIREVAEIYSGKELPELPVQYADFAVWQREWLSGEELERQLAFWRRELAGAPPALELPTDRPRPPIESFHGASFPVTLGVELSQGLRALSRSRGVTPFMTMTAALAALLSRWTGQDDIVVGSPIANRQAPELAGLIGMFVNTLALRVRLGRASTFDALLAQVRRTALEAFEHQDLPFERLVEELKIGRDLSRHPLFQAVLAFQNVRLGRPEDLEIPGLVLEPLGQESATTKFDLTFTLFEGEDGLAGQLEFATDLFDRATIERLLGHLRNLLAGIAAAPGSLLEELPLLGEEERRQLLAWSGAALTHRREATIHGLFAEQAARTPDAVAVVLGDEEWTYGELAARAGRVASHLLRLGVAPETRVAVVGERSFDLIAALLGILQAGCAYLPLDPEHPPERQAFMLADAGASLLLDLEGAEEPSVPRPSQSISPDQLAYVMYTSGSTGNPKGVAVTHRNVVRLIQDQSFADFGPRETFLQLAPLAFDASTLEIWVPLLNGGRLVLFPGRRASLDEIGAAIARHGVTLLWLTAGLFHQQVDERPEALRPLRQLLAGGDVLDPAHVRRALAALPDLRLVNGYGPTENTTFTACHAMSASTPPAATVPIGRPVAGTSVYVLGADLSPVPEGVWGELFAGGDGVARGYLGRPELTAERFVPDPFGPEPGGRLYRSGDLVRWHGGVLEFLGRRDGQVKIRGNRVELGEIEAALTGHPAVREAVVLLREERLVAWITATPDGSPDPAELRRHLAARLPEPMIPSAFVILDRFPLTANGKVDRRALPAPEGPEPAATFEAPATPVEESLTAACAELLGLERVGVRDNFFALGGHSLLATQLVARLRERHGLDVPLQRVFDAADFRELANRIVERAADDSAPIPRLAVRPDPLPLSFGQQRLWFLDRLRPGDPSYNVPAVLEITGALSPAALRQALEELAARHEVLRTTFADVDDQPAQVVAPLLAVPLPLVDLAALPQTARTPEAERLVQEDVVRPFDLTAGPLLRALLVKQDPSLHVLTLSLHHIVCDGWSLGVLVREMAALYENASSGTPASLPSLPIQYADFAVWQRQWLQGDRLEKQLAFWRDGLAGIEPLRLPTDRPRPTRRGSAGGVRPVVVETADSARLQALALREKATLFIVLLAAWEALLGRLAGQDDLAVGTPVANRNRSETAGLIGFFVNTLVLRGDLSGDPTFRELVGRLRAVALAAFAHQDLPFERLVEELRLERDPSRTPLFQALLVLQNAPSSALNAGDLEIRDLAAPTATAKFDLSLSLIELPEGLKGALEFSAELFDGATAARFARTFEILLAAALANPELRLSDLPLATQAERHQLVVEWNPAGEGSSLRAPLHRLFEAQVDRAPDAPAVTADGETLTYRELDARANRLARHLLASGVRPGDLVAVKFERSAEMLVAVLAVLKTGGAYLPLDPSYPPERLAFALEDSGAGLLLTREMLDAEAEIISARSSDRLSVPADPELPAYVIYTSGSTGQPKGVVIPHGHVTRLFSATQGWFGFGPDDVWTLFHSHAFDFSVWEIWGALLHGGRLVVVPHWQARSPEAFYALLRDERVTVLNQTPSAFRQLLWAEEAVLEGAQPDLALRYVIFGGEALEPSSLGPWFDRHGDEKPLLVNMYGITETTVHVTYRPVRRGDLAAGSVLGLPIPDLALYVLDRSLTPQPIGVPGEIVVGGEGVARGYLGRPELTAERFVPDPWGAAPGSRLYRSGDLARRLPDGDLEYLGRIDLQVKIRGYRIELGEVEAALARHPAVREAVVGTTAGPGGETRLVAWITVDSPVPDGAPSLAELRAFLAAILPEPMLPSALVVLDRFPLTRNGKLDRASLPEPTDGPPVLWLFLLGTWSSLILYLTRHRLRVLAPYAQAVLLGFGAFFGGLLVFAETPFGKSPMPVSEGAGLNPLLRDPGMMIHPPMLYSGYTLFAIPFAFAVAALITRRLDAEWIRSTRPFTLAAWCALGFGIVLGARWSYHELDWGGYWMWDPVENASLMPWLTATAFMHSVMIQERRGMLRIWNVSLVLATGVLAILGTFLVRSGVLNSIHAFGASTLGVPFLVLIACMIAGSIFLVASRADSLRSKNRLDSLLSREAVFLLNNLL
ncbi:MAG TPA: amino acid adenylation domain-containing protein, partial [Thermoanaerobaculia bacterium]|nr:amino acid adenylation domain-containing protein [Thermoanaerobaculia bacterium]